MRFSVKNKYRAITGNSRYSCHASVTLFGFFKARSTAICKMPLPTHMTGGQQQLVFGWVILANDVAQVSFRTVHQYNLRVCPEDKIW